MDDSISLDSVTGEIFSWDSTPIKKLKKHKRQFYVGQDCKYPRDKSAISEELYLIAKDLDVFSWRELEINHWALIESLRAKLLSPTEIEIITTLSEMVNTWNVCFCTIQDFPCHEKASYKFLKNLQPWSLRVITQSSGKLKLELNPFLVWKGDKLRREKAIKEWYAKANTGLQSISD
jgi:hypothetical protein